MICQATKRALSLHRNPSKKRSHDNDPLKAQVTTNDAKNAQLAFEQVFKDLMLGTFQTNLDFFKVYNQNTTVAQTLEQMMFARFAKMLSGNGPRPAA